jgi:hypothetical protein
MAIKQSLIGIEIKSRLIPGTYSDLWKTKDYLSVSLFDPTTIDAKIQSQAFNAKDKINAFIGRSSDFTEVQLETTLMSGIVDSASQLTACLVQKNPQGAAMDYTEDTVEDCKEAFKTLTNWCINNGIALPGKAHEPKYALTELVYETNDAGGVI